MQDTVRKRGAKAPFRNTSTAFTAANQVLPIGQLAYETDTGKWKRGDGKTAWSGLSYLN